MTQTWHRDKPLNDTYSPDKTGEYYNRKLEKRTLVRSRRKGEVSFSCKETNLTYKPMIREGRVHLSNMIMTAEDIMGPWSQINAKN